MVEVEVGRGDSLEALELVAAVEACVQEGFGPTTPDRTSTVTAGEMVPPDSAYVIVREDGRAVAGGGVRRLLSALEASAADLGCGRARLDTAQSMTTAMALYRSAGYREIADYNGNGYASFWGEKRL